MARDVRRDGGIAGRRSQITLKVAVIGGLLLALVAGGVTALVNALGKSPPAPVVADEPGARVKYYVVPARGRSRWRTSP